MSSKKHPVHFGTSLSEKCLARTACGKGFTCALFNSILISTLVFSAMLHIPLHAQQTKKQSYIRLGLWNVSNTILENNSAIVNDGVGDTYLNSQHTLLLADAKIKHNFSLGNDKQAMFHSKIKSRFNLSQSPYTLSYNENARFELQSFYLTLKQSISGKHDLSLGRKRLLKNAGVRFDGAEVLLRPKEQWEISIYGGLGENPRNSIGFIGDNFANQIVDSNFIAFGSSVHKRSNTTSFDLGLNALLYKGDWDRAYHFFQITHQPNKKLFISLLNNTAYVPVSLDQLLLSFRYKYNDKLSQSLYVQHWSNVEFAASMASQIPVNGQASPTSYINGNAFNDTYVQTAKTQFRYRFNSNSSVYTGFEYSKRSFDNLDRQRIIFGTKHIDMFDDTWDLSAQLAYLNNYRSGHISADFSVAKSLWQDQLYIKTFINRIQTQRQIWLNNQASNIPNLEEIEWSLGLSLQAELLDQYSLLLQYQYQIEEESSNTGEQVKLHDVYASVQARF